MSQPWTKEPWVVGEECHQEHGRSVRWLAHEGQIVCKGFVEDMIRIQQCVNGCAGLNPAAYKECVEALKALKLEWEALADNEPLYASAAVVGKIYEALARTQEVR